MRAFFQIDQQHRVGNFGLEGRPRRAMDHAERMHPAAPGRCLMPEIFTAALPAHALLVVLHMAAIAAVLQQQHAIAQAAP